MLTARIAVASGEIRLDRSPRSTARGCGCRQSRRRGELEGSCRYALGWYFDCGL